MSSEQSVEKDGTRVWLTDDDRESLTDLVKTWLPVSYGGLIPRLELWVTDRDQRVRNAAERVLRPGQPGATA